MKKIPSLFCRNYDGDGLVRDEYVPESMWVVAGEGRPTVKVDGTAVMIAVGIDMVPVLMKRYDRKLNPKTGAHKPAPDGWIPCEDTPNEHTGHWPGWLPVGDEPESRWIREAFENSASLIGGTYEAVGPMIQGNPYSLLDHVLVAHGSLPPWFEHEPSPYPDPTFASVHRWCLDHPEHEGIVWHHVDGRMAKIKRRDFGLTWPDNK